MLPADLEPLSDVVDRFSLAG
ncbi:MAG: hypothetical protein ACXV6L_07050, partial [Halobacteriota archaeon]